MIPRVYTNPDKNRPTVDSLYPKLARDKQICSR